MKSLTALAALVFAAACSDSSAPEPSRATSIAVAAGNAQTVRVATVAGTPLSVLVKDQHGMPMGAATVTFTASGNGSFDSPSVYTDSSGVASVVYTLGTKEGTDSVFARVDGITGAAVFTITAEPGPPMQLEDVGPTQETGTPGTTLATPFSVQLVDLFGNPIAGATVTWTTTDGTLSATSVTTDENGTASVALTLGANPGTETVTAHVVGGGGGGKKKKKKKKKNEGGGEKGRKKTPHLPPFPLTSVLYSFLLFSSNSYG